MKGQDLNEEEIQRWRNKLHALQTACGCKAGMAALLLSLILCIHHFIYAGAMYSRPYKIVVTLLICLAAAVTGKVMGMVWARYRHAVLKNRLVKRLAIDFGGQRPRTDVPAIDPRWAGSVYPMKFIGSLGWIPLHRTQKPKLLHQRHLVGRGKSPGPPESL